MNRHLDRPRLRRQLDAALRRSPAVSLLGPRQCGKTTLVRDLAERRKAEYFDLEDPRSLRRLDQPMSALEPLRGLVIIDEVQLRPDIFPILRVLIDRRPSAARFLLLGSASPDLIREASESLAGRIEQIEMSGFSLEETGASALRALWLRGGFPRSFLAVTDADSLVWRENFIQTFLERDLARLGVRIPAAALRRLWTMLAHYHGQVGNASEIGRSLGITHPTVKHHLDILTGALVVRQLQPWFENLGKRQVKSPKIYLRDSGLLHALLGIGRFPELESHPKLGASWEGFAIEEALRVVGERQAYFWATPAGAELDLFLPWRGNRIGVEVKYADAPATTRSMAVAMRDLRLDQLLVVYPGTKPYVMAPKIEAVPLAELPERLRRLGGRETRG